MGRLSGPRQIPSVLDEHVLKSTSSADQRDVPLARFPNDFMDSLRVAVWAAGPDDECRSSGGDLGNVTNRVSGNDPNIDGNPPIVRGMAERLDGCAVVPVVGRQINQNIDEDGAHR